MSDKKEIPDYLERVIIEYAELKAKIAPLAKMLASEKPAFVSDTQWVLLEEQHSHMTNYQTVLYKRITDSLRAL